jgi:hypothetical protein
LRPQQLGLIIRQYAFQLQVTKKHFKRNDVPADRCRSQFLGGEPRRVVGKLRDGQPLDPPPTEPCEKVPQVALVRGDAVFGQVAFAPQIARERLTPTGSILRRGQTSRYDLFAVLGHDRSSHQYRVPLLAAKKEPLH